MSNSTDNKSYSSDAVNPLHGYQTSEEEEMAKAIAQKLYRYDHLADKRVASLNDITDEHVNQFWQQGYLVVDNAYSNHEVEQAKDAIMDLLHKRSDGGKIQLVRPYAELKTEQEIELAARKVYNFYNKDSRLTDFSNHPSIMSLMEKLFSEKAKVVQDMAILKPPTGGAEKPWHQDMAYGRLAYDKSVIGVWTALDPAELDNGCMHVIPYSHMQGGTPHYAVRDWQICDRNVLVDQDVAVPLNPGGILVFSGLLHHGTPPNFSNKRRRAVQIHYAPESAKKLTPIEYKRIFTNAMSGAEC